MKRKVIQIANSTQLVSLPRKWSQKYGIKKGDELDVDEQGNKLIVGTEKGVDFQKIEIDVTGLDRTSILYYIQSLYRVGYNEFVVRFNEPYTIHLRTNEKKSVISVIHDVVNRLTGIEIVQQKDNFCIIKDISEISSKEFDTALRRIFLLLLDVNKDLLEGVKNDNQSLIDTIDEKHNSVMKFVSYCLRIINKKGYGEPQKAIIIYHIIANLDKIVDVIKYSARYLLDNKVILKKESKMFLDLIHSGINDYYDFFYKFDVKKMRTMYENRDRVIKLIDKNIKKLPPQDIVYICNLSSMLELIVDITDSRISLEY